MKGNPSSAVLSPRSLRVGAALLVVCGLAAAAPAGVHAGSADPPAVADVPPPESAPASDEALPPESGPEGVPEPPAVVRLSAPPPPAPAAEGKHAARLRRLFFRAALGPGYAHVFSDDLVRGQETLGGLSANLGLDLGAFLTRRFALAAHVSGVGSLLPVGQLGGIARVGVSATGYLGPWADWYLTGSANLNIGGISDRLGGGLGFGGVFGFGREWALGRSWSVALQGHIFYDTMVGLFLLILPTSSWNIFGAGVSVAFVRHAPPPDLRRR